MGLMVRKRGDNVFVNQLLLLKKKNTKVNSCSNRLETPLEIRNPAQGCGLFSELVLRHGALAFGLKNYAS